MIFSQICREAIATFSDAFFPPKLVYVIASRTVCEQLDLLRSANQSCSCYFGNGAMNDGLFRAFQPATTPKPPSTSWPERTRDTSIAYSATFTNRYK